MSLAEEHQMRALTLLAFLQVVIDILTEDR